MNTAILQRTDERLQSLGHEVRWLMEGQTLAYGRCAKCGAGVRIEVRGSNYRALGPALETICSGPPS